METNTQGSAHQNEMVSDQNFESSETQESSTKQDVPSYEWHRRVLADSKKMKSQLEQANEKLKAFEQKELETKGHHAELIQALRAENNSLKQEVAKRDEVYTWAQVETELKSAASQMGCSQPNHLLRLIDSEMLNAIEVDENYRPVKEDVNRVLESVKSNPEYSYLFKTNARTVDTVNPVNKIEKEDPNDITKMSREQKLKMLSGLLKT